MKTWFPKAWLILHIIIPTVKKDVVIEKWRNFCCSSTSDFHLTSDQTEQKRKEDATLITLGTNKTVAGVYGKEKGIEIEIIIWF